MEPSLRSMTVSGTFNDMPFGRKNVRILSPVGSDHLMNGYCATKGAIVSLTKQVAIQYAGTGVRCNCICPGTVDSPWVGRLLAEADDPDAARAALVARQPLGRLGTPEEVAKAAVYLASDDAAFITGTALVIDGGIAAG